MMTTSKVMMTTTSIAKMITTDSAENSFCFTEVDSSIDLLIKQLQNPLLNTDVQIYLLKM